MSKYPYNRVVVANVALSVLISGGGCTSEDASSASHAEERTATVSQNVTATSSVAPKRHAAFKMVRERRTHSELANKATHFASVVQAEEVDPSAVSDAIVRGRAAQVGRALHAPVKDRPNLVVSYHDDSDALQVNNEDATRDTASNDDIGLPAALEVYKKGFAQLDSRKAIETVGLDAANPTVGRIVQIEGISGALPVRRTKEYIFTTPRKVNGIEVFNGGVEISVHRNGRIARIKAFGPSVRSSVASDRTEQPIETGYNFSQVVSNADVDARVNSEYPGHKITPHGTRYWLQDSADSAVVEPQQMYLVNPVTTVDGVQVNGRAFYVAYSLSSASSAPRIWPTPKPLSAGDKR